MLLQWISQISFSTMLRLVRINTSASFSSFPFLFLPSSLFSSLLPSSFNKLRVYASIDSPRKKWHLQAVTVCLYARPISKEFALTLTGSRSPNVTYCAWSSYICFLLLLNRPDTSVHALNFQVRCVHYIHKYMEPFNCVQAND